MYNSLMKTSSMKNQISYHRGFTLMEVMVSVSIFTIVVTVGIGALLSINESYRKSQTDRKTIDSLAYTLESMSRRIRTAKTWTTASGSPTTSFAFIDQDGIIVSYQYDTVTPDHIAMTQSNPITGSIETSDITPADVRIDTSFPGGGMIFTPYESPDGQKYLQINIGGKVDEGRQTSEFVLQTSVSKRSFD